jgi:hypothetical protein
MSLPECQNVSSEDGMALNRNGGRGQPWRYAVSPNITKRRRSGRMNTPRHGIELSSMPRPRPLTHALTASSQRSRFRGGKVGVKMLVEFRIRTPSVPRASIIWLAHAVNVVRPAASRLHIDRVRFAKGWHLGITLGVCMSG